jgi:phage major head subunit gpT-like protein
MSKTSIYATYIAMRRFKSDIGQRISIQPDTLLVPDALLPTALEVVGTEKGLYTAEGTKNIWQGKFNVIPYLRLDDTSTTNWFMIDSRLMKKYLIWLDRVKPETETFYDQETKAIKHSIYFRIANGTLNWRFLMGHSV